MTTPRVTVPVDMNCPKCGARSGDDWEQRGGRCPMPGSPHYSAAPAPEGGAVERACVVFQEAIDDFEAEVADVMAEGSERADLWDREITVNIDALKTVMSAALAAREEAPAEAGEDELKAIARIIFPESERVKMDRDWGGNRSHSRDCWNKAIGQATEILAMLTAAPVREEGGVVSGCKGCGRGPMEHHADWCPSLKGGNGTIKAACIAWHRAKGSDPFNVLYHGAWCGSFPHQTGPERWTFTVPAMKEAIAAYLRAQPPAREDALREKGVELVEALKRYGFPVSGAATVNLGAFGSSEAMAVDFTTREFIEALAALQAEQGAK